MSSMSDVMMKTRFDVKLVHDMDQDTLEGLCCVTSYSALNVDVLVIPPMLIM